MQDGMAVAGDALEIDVETASSGSATPANPTNVNAAGSEEVPASDEMAVDGGDQTLHANSNGIIDEDPVQPAAAEPPPAPAPRAQVQATQAQAPQADPRQALLQDPQVQALLQAQVQQYQPLLQQAQAREQQFMQMQQQFNQQNQMLSTLRDTIAQRQALAAREATKPRPPPEGFANEMEKALYDRDLRLWETGQHQQELSARLSSMERAYTEQVRAQAMQAQQARQDAQFRQQAAEYDAKMAKILAADDYKFLKDKGMPELDAQGRPTGQNISAGQAFFGSLYNQWCQAVADECQQNGQAYQAPDPTLLANQMRDWALEVAQMYGASIPARGVQAQAATPQQRQATNAVQAQRQQQAQRTQQLKGAAPLRSAQAAAPSTGKATTQKELHAQKRHLYFPSDRGDKTIIPN